MSRLNLLLLACLAVMVVTGSTYAASAVEVNGDLTLTGDAGVVFPDGTVQTTASVPTWSQILTTNRFVSVLGGAGQLDRETGLVWATAPDSTLRVDGDAIFYCNTLYLGGRGGWRLPTVAELYSLVDKSNANPALPAGHPFTNVQPDLYWSSTYWGSTTALVWVVNMGDGTVDYIVSDISTYHYLWCVRGGQ
jgi:hypothetical protein